MRVVFVGSSFGEYSGALKRAKALSDKNILVDIVFYYSPKYIFEKNGFFDRKESDDLFYQQIKLIDDSISGTVKLVSADSPFSLGGIIKLLSYLRQSKPSAVFCHHSFISPLAAIVSKLAGVNKIYMLEMSDVRRKHVLLRIFTAAAYLFATKIISISKATQNSMGFLENLTSFGRKKVIYNGVDLGIIKSSDVSIADFLEKYGLSKGGYIYYAGRFVNVKNLPLLIEAFRGLKDLGGFDNIKLVLSGAGPETTNIREMAVAYGLEGDVIFTGNVSYSEVLSFMRGASVFTMCSHSEGFSESIVQAMAIGTSIITTANPSFSEALSGGCGMLVQSNIDEYATGLSKILTDKQLRNSYALKSVKKAGLYNIDTIADQYIDLIDPQGGGNT